MSNGNGSGGSSKRIEMLKDWTMSGLTVIIIYVIICICVSLYIRFVSDRSDPTSMWYAFPKWVQPAKQWKKLAGIEVGSYSFIPSSLALSYITVPGSDSVLSNVTSVNDCMLACEGKAPECIGFSFNTISNTCSLASMLDGVIPSESSNVLYYSDVSPPLKQYFIVPQKIPATPVPINFSSVSIPTSTNVATVTTSTDHGFKTGHYVTTTGYGSNAITVTDSTHFTFPYRVAADVTTGVGTATLLLSLITPDLTLSYIDCAKTCYSNTTCSGFTFSSSSGCIPYTITPFTKDFLTQTSATSNTYIPGTPVLTPYTSSYY
jgi:hypothetical protein